MHHYYRWKLRHLLLLLLAIRHQRHVHLLVRSSHTDIVNQIVDLLHLTELPKALERNIRIALIYTRDHAEDIITTIYWRITYYHIAIWILCIVTKTLKRWLLSCKAKTSYTVITLYYFEHYCLFISDVNTEVNSHKLVKIAVHLHDWTLTRNAYVILLHGNHYSSLLTLCCYFCHIKNYIVIAYFIIIWNLVALLYYSFVIRI